MDSPLLLVIFYVAPGSGVKMAPTNSTPPGWSYQPWSFTGHKSQFNDKDVPQPDNAEFDINGSVEVSVVCDNFLSP